MFQWVYLHWVFCPKTTHDLHVLCYDSTGCYCIVEFLDIGAIGHFCHIHLELILIFKENMEIRHNSPGYQIHSEGGMLTLYIKKVSVSFAGKFMCALKNKFGDASIYAKLSVESEFNF